MLAQKTPTTALLINYSETWNSLYYQDLTYYQNQLVEDYLLRFLLLSYIRIQRNWLHRFSVKKVYGKYYIQLFCITSYKQRFHFPGLLQPARFFAPFLQKRRLPFKYRKIKGFYWNYFLPKMLPIYKIKKTRQRWSNITRFQYMHSRYITKFLPERVFQKWFQFLSKKLQKVSVPWRSKLRQFKHLKKLIKSKRIFSLFKSNHQNSAFILVKKLQNPTFSKTQLTSSYKLIKFGVVITSNLTAKPYKLMQYILKWVCKFFRRRTANWSEAIMWWLLKWSHKLRFKRNIMRRLQALSFFWQAMCRLTKTQCLIYYKASTWNRSNYKTVSFYTIFERFRSKPFLVHILVTTHYAISQGTPVILTDYIRAMLIVLVQHKTFLKSIHTALRYYLSFQGYLIMDPASFCQGAKVVVSGKIDGGNRKKTMSFLIGRIPTGSNDTHIVYDQSTIITRYGSLHVHIWFSYKYFNTRYLVGTKKSRHVL